MALNTTPEEAKAIHELASEPAHKMSSKWITNEDGYYNQLRNRYLDAIRCALKVVSAGVSVPALEVNKFLASSSIVNFGSSDYEKIANEIEAEILGYAIEALTDPETLELFKSIANNNSITALDKC